jgi:hypothetical protein
MASTGLYYHAPAGGGDHSQPCIDHWRHGDLQQRRVWCWGHHYLALWLLTTLDGYSLANTNRILVKDEVNEAYNGVYTWATGGTVLTCSTDTDSYGPGTGDLSEYDYFFVSKTARSTRANSFVGTTSWNDHFWHDSHHFLRSSARRRCTRDRRPIQVSGTVISLNTVPVNLGGTNITSYATGDLLYASGTTTLARPGRSGTTNYVSTSSGTAPQYVA